MKTTKRFASLFLAMLMAFSLMAVTASACDAGHAPKRQFSPGGRRHGAILAVRR